MTLMTNRILKARRFADHLQKAHDAEAVAGFDAKDWADAAKRIDEMIPSAETIELVVATLFDREQMALADPFDIPPGNDRMVSGRGRGRR